MIARARVTAWPGSSIAAAEEAGFLLDEDSQFDALGDGGAGEIGGVGLGLAGDDNLGLPGEGTEAFDLGGGHDFAGDEDAGNAAMDHDLGLGDLGGADSSDGPATANLAGGDGRSLVVLAVAAQLAGAVPVVVGHDVHVVIEGVKVEDEAGSVQVFHGGSDGGTVALVHDESTPEGHN